MHTAIDDQAVDTEERSTSLASGPGGPIFQMGPQVRCYRAPVRAIASVRVDDREIFGQVLDISLGGCLLKTEATIEVGQVLEMQITIIGDGRRAVADVRGVIQRVTEVGGRRGYGVELVADDSAERRSLQWLYSQALR